MRHIQPCLLLSCLLSSLLSAGAFAQTTSTKTTPACAGGFTWIAPYCSASPCLPLMNVTFRAGPPPKCILASPKAAAKEEEPCAYLRGSKPPVPKPVTLVNGRCVYTP